MEKKITLKVWLAVFFRGIWQGVCYVFSWPKKSLFRRVICSVIALCVVAVTVMMGYAFYDEFYVRRHGWYYGDERTRISSDLMFYDIERGRGKSYVENIHTGKKVLKGLDWVACSQDGDSLAVFAKGGKRGYFNRFTGEVVIPARYDAAWCFNDSVAGVCVGDSVFFIDHKGKPINQRKFQRREATAYLYHGDLAIIPEGKKVGLFDREGNEFLPARYDYIGFMEKDMLLTVEGDKHGLLDSAGREVLPAEYAGISVYEEGGIVVQLPDYTKKRFDYDGTLLDDFVYDYVVGVPYTVGMNESGETVEALTGMLAYNVDGNSGLMDGQGHPVTLPIYDQIRAMGPNLFDCRIAGTCENVLIDSRGRKVND